MTLPLIDWTAIALFVLSGVGGGLWWLLRTMHAENKQRIERIVDSLSPLPVIQENVSSLKATVGDHVKILPELKTEMALLSQGQTIQGEKIETINMEVSKLREWRHDVSNSLHVQALKEEARKP